LLTRTEAKLPETEYAKLAPDYERCIHEIEHLTRYADRAEEDLLAKTKDVMTQVRNLERATRGRGENYEIALAVNTVQMTLIKQAAALTELLALPTEAGATDPH